MAQLAGSPRQSVERSVVQRRKLVGVVKCIIDYLIIKEDDQLHTLQRLHKLHK